MRPRHPRVALALLCSLAALLHCGGKPSAGTAPRVGRIQSKHPAPPPPLPSEFLGQAPAAQKAEILDLLPDNTVAAIVARSPVHLIAATEAVSIVREYREFFESGNAPLSKGGAARLLEPSTWIKLGSNPAGPVAAAMSVETNAVSMFLATLSDSEAFLDNVASAAATFNLQALPPQRDGEVALIRFANEENLVLLVRDQAVLLVVAASAQDLGPLLPRLTKQVVGASFRKLFTSFDYGDDVSGFVSLPTVAAKLLDERRHEVEDGYWANQVEAIETELEGAANTGQDQAKLDELESKLQHALEGYERRSLRESATGEILRDVLSKIGMLTFGIDLDGPSSGIRVRIEPARGSLPARLLRPHPKPLQLPLRLGETPMWLLDGHLDKKAAAEAFRLMINADGLTQIKLATKIKKELGIDLNEVLALLGGEIGGALTIDTELATSGASHGLHSALGVHILAELNDEVKARKLLNQAAASPEMQRYRVGTDEDTELRLPAFGNRELRVTLSGRYLEIKSTAKVTTASAFQEHEQALLSQPGNQALMVLDPTMLSLWLFAGYEPTDEVWALPVPPRAGGLVSPHEKNRRVAEINQEIKALRTERNTKKTARGIAGSKALGRVFLVARPEGIGHVAIVGGLRGAASNLGRGIQSVAEALSPELEEMRTGTESDIAVLEKKIRKLNEERWSMR